VSHHHELAHRRTQMGRSMIPMVASEGPPAFGDIGDGYWIGLSGAPSPDVNVALIDTDDPAVVTSVLNTVDSKGFPTSGCWPVMAPLATLAPIGSTSVPCRS
jgi:hypothetical protein